MSKSAVLLLLISALIPLVADGGEWASRKVGKHQTEEFRNLLENYRKALNIKDVAKMLKFEDIPFLGVEMEEAKDEKKTVYGVKLRRVYRDSPAHKCGLRTGDVIVTFNGERIPDKDSVWWVRNRLADCKAGAEVSVTVRRDGKEQELKLILGKMPEPQPPRAHPELDQNAAPSLSLLESHLREEKLLEDYLEVRRMFHRVTKRPFAPQEVKGNTILHPHLLSEVVYLLRNPEQSLLLAQQTADFLTSCFNSYNQDVAGLLHSTADKLDVTLKDYQLVKETEFTFAQFVEVVERCTDSLKKLFEKLPEEKRRELSETLMRAILREETDETEKKELMLFSLSFDYETLYRTAEELLRHLTATTIKAIDADLCGLTPLKEEVKGVEGKVLFHSKTEFGRIVVGSDGNNRYEGDDFLLIIDTGGDDVYAGGATASASPKRPLTLIIDFGGDDLYTAKGDGGCGSAVFGISVLFDVSGDDTYIAETAAEGVGVFGVGALIDLAGDDTYKAEAFCQGAAAFGIGMLLDAETQPKVEKRFTGSDKYLASHYAQGFGMPRGFGLLIDTEGNDLYQTGSVVADFRAPHRSAISLSQGFGYGWRPYSDPNFGAAGGFGFLCDINGHDTYICDYFGQGSSYWFAFGTLYDRSGDDTYIAGRYSQGAGIHLSLGVLIDNSGNDRYSAYVGVSQGCGHDIAAGILYDGAGNDIYSSGWLAQGAGNANGIGVLLDVSGNDMFHTTAPNRAQPTGNLFKKRGDVPSFGVLLDLAGKDSYTAEGRVDGTALVIGKDEKEKKLRWGIFIDPPK